MPRIVDYETVKRVMVQRGFVSLYHNSGAFGFAAGASFKSVGWIEADDPTIRETALALARHVDSITNLFPLALSQINSPAWLMPKSHWHYELHFGNRELLEKLLPSLGIDVKSLRDRNDGSAIEFDSSQHDLLKDAVRDLLDGLRGSDFMLAFPEARTLCTIHHHRQLWWQTADESVHPILIG